DFNQAVKASTFTAADVILRDPNGVTIGTSSPALIPSTNGKSWGVTFSALTTYGTYTVLVGPHISDLALANDEMNQNNNQISGEAGDQFSGTFIVKGLQVVSVTPDPTKPVLANPGAGLSSIVITFNQAVDPATFPFTGPGDQILLTDPTGAAVAIQSLTP